MTPAKQLVIVGAGGFGREVLGYARCVEAISHDWSLLGFIDRDSRALDRFSVGVEVVGDPDTFVPEAHHVFVCAIGDPRTKLRVCRELQSRGATFINLFHPTSLRGPDCEVGIGCVFGPFSCLTANVRVGSFVTVNAYSSLGHDSVVHDGCTLSGHCDVTGFAVLGEGAFLGSHACVAPGVEIGRFARVGAGSAAVRPIPPNATAMGVPARVIFESKEP